MHFISHLIYKQAGSDSGLHLVVSPASTSVLQLDGCNFILPSPVASFWPMLGYSSYLVKPKFESENNHITTFPLASSMVCLLSLYFWSSFLTLAHAASSPGESGSVPGLPRYISSSTQSTSVLGKEKLNRFDHWLLESQVLPMRNLTRKLSFWYGNWPPQTPCTKL